MNFAESDCGVYIQCMQASYSRELDLFPSCLVRREDMRPMSFGHGCGSLNVLLGAYVIVDEHI